MLFQRRRLTGALGRVPDVPIVSTAISALTELSGSNTTIAGSRIVDEVTHFIFGR